MIETNHILYKKGGYLERKFPSSIKHDSCDQYLHMVYFGSHFTVQYREYNQNSTISVRFSCILWLSVEYRQTRFRWAVYCGSQ